MRQAITIISAVARTKHSTLLNWLVLDEPHCSDGQQRELPLLLNKTLCANRSHSREGGLYATNRINDTQPDLQRDVERPLAAFDARAGSGHVARGRVQ